MRALGAQDDADLDIPLTTKFSLGRPVQSLEQSFVVVAVQQQKQQQQQHFLLAEPGSCRRRYVLFSPHLQRLADGAASAFAASALEPATLRHFASKEAVSAAASETHFPRLPTRRPPKSCLHHNRPP